VNPEPLEYEATTLYKAKYVVYIITTSLRSVDMLQSSSHRGVTFRSSLQVETADVAITILNITHRRVFV
jgi:hypothetical protein